MKNLSAICFIILIINYLSIFSLKAQTGTGNLRGTITDENGLPLVGATIVITDLQNMGTTADPNGNYQLMTIPSGKHTVKISFIGYEQESRIVEINRGGIIILDVQMKVSLKELLEIVAYGQAKGQTAAIIQQLSSSGISNIVSVEKLQELPDVNIAEAIGRLPGLMVDRNRGEGQKIIIRGLEPKYNTISIGGNNVPSTSPDDRSTDLNMISPDIIGGVEVQKATTADKDASGLGGTVNFTLKEAPSGRRVYVSFLPGYNSLSNSISNYQAEFHMSNRFFNNKVGIMLSGSATTADRDTDHGTVDYEVQGDPNYSMGETFVKPWITSINLSSNTEERSRAGGSLLLDWKVSPATTIKSSSFIGYLKQEIFDLNKQYDLGSNFIDYIVNDNNQDQLLYSNSIEGRHFIFGSILDWGGSRAQSNNNSPYRHSLTFRQLGVFNDLARGKSYDIEPPEFVPTGKNVNDFPDRSYFYEGRFRTYKAEETESSLFLNWEVPFRFGKNVWGKIKAGTKYRVKDRFRENTLYDRRIDSPEDVLPYIEKYPETILTKEGFVGRISMLNFIDKDYEPRDFLNDKYELFRIDRHFDPNILPDVYDGFLKNFYWLDETEKEDNYDTREKLFSNYLMAELNIGRYITFIPGIRYENTNIRYGAYVAEEGPSSGVGPRVTIYRDTLATNMYTNFFPQIHLRIKPTDYFDIRLAYTKTIARPDYNDLAPKKLISGGSKKVTLGNTNLSPALSTNYDVILTFFKQKYGLFTLGVFQKEIKGFQWRRDALILKGTPTDPVNFGLNPGLLGYNISYPINNPHHATIKGFEMDLQSNLDFLPFKGLVLNMNLTLMTSETKYNETLIVRAANPDFGKIPGAPRTIFVNQDTAYVDRLLKQPSYLGNISLGYDNKKIGLSVRLSFNYQDDILTQEQRRPDGADREATQAFYRWDFQATQKITKRMKLRLNVANIFNQPDRGERLITGYMQNIEYSGTMTQLGLRYDIF